MIPTETVVSDFLGCMPAALALVRAIEYRLLSRFDYPPPVVDIGCGDGFFGSYLFKGWNQSIDLGIELDPRQAREARGSGGYKEVLVCNTCDVPYSDAHFQTIFSNCVFEHIPYLVEVFMEIHRLLKPGGRYIFTAHSHYYNDYLFTAKWLRRLGLTSMAGAYVNLINYIFQHFNCLTPEEWGWKLGKAGLELVHYEYYLGPSVLSAFDRLLPLSAPAYFWHRLFHRYTLLPRSMARLVFQRYICDLVEEREPTGGGLLLVAKRKED